MKSIGIDIGTTTISINVVEEDGPKVWKKETLENGSFLHTSNPWERIQDVDKILQKAVSALENILEETGDVCAIGLTGQMHGIVYVDGEGRGVSPLYTWQDSRGAQPEFQGKSICDLLWEKYGIKSAPGYGVITHLYNLKMGCVPPQAVSFCTIADYLGMVLTGRKKPLVHASQGASLGLFDGKNLTFQKEIASDFGMDPSFFPEITEELAILGEFRGIPVSVSLGDNQASFLGSVRQGRDTLLVNVGTGAQISLMASKVYEGKGIEARPFLKGHTLLVGSTLCGGAAYAGLENFFREYAVAAGAPDVPQYQVMEKLLETQDASQECWQVRTTFSGTRLDPQQAGGVEGIRIENFHPGYFIRGVLDGMAQELFDLYQVIQKEAGLSRNVIAASGNGVRKNKILQKVLADRFQMPLEVVDNEEEAAFGAAISAMGAIGRMSLDQWLGL